jgi:ribosomal protein S18 acetylase RimI-like enzyme
MIVRSALSSDFEEIYSVHQACLDRRNMPQYSDEQILALRRNIVCDDYRAEFQNENVLVLKSTLIMGFASWLDDTLLSFYVKPRYQGEKLGSYLLYACAEQAREQGGFIKNVHATLNSVGFYEKHGFKVVAYATIVREGVEIPYREMSRPRI